MDYVIPPQLPCERLIVHIRMSHPCPQPVHSTKNLIVIAFTIIYGVGKFRITHSAI